MTRVDGKDDEAIDEKDGEGRDSLEDDAMRKLLKRSLGGDDLGDGAPSAAGEAPPSMLPAVQKKLRERSKGKFYSDGWSTSQSKVSYILVAVVMLLVIAICYFAMGPVGVSH